MSASDKIRHLKLLIGQDEIDNSVEYWKAPGLISGVPRGVVVELTGLAKVEWLLEFLKLNSKLNVFWSEKDQHILPTAIHQRSVDLTRITFGIFRHGESNAMRLILKSQEFDILVAPNRFTELKTYKAFQLFSKQNDSTLILLSNSEPATAWPISLQLTIHPDKRDGYRMEILRQKHRGVP